MSGSVPVAIVGAGPYGLAAAAHLRHAGVEVRAYGEVMGFWRTMPAGMCLRSYRRSSNIGDPDGALTLPAYERARGYPLSSPTTLTDFIEYGCWFQAEAGVPVDPRMVTSLTSTGSAFHLRLGDGARVDAQRVVIATGITPFAWRPPLFEGLDPALVSHTSDHRDYTGFAGRRVAVVGGGQSALEAAALLHEERARAELVVRRSALRFLRGERLYETGSVLSDVLYPAWGVGPPGVNWLMGRPGLFRRLPASVSAPLARRAIRPAGAAWVAPRLGGVAVTAGRTVVSLAPAGGGLRLGLDDGSTREVDHVVLGTGYRIDLTRYGFFDADLLRQIRLTGSYPRLSSTFESSVRGLHFVGGPAAASAGPGMRFVSHTAFGARAITRAVLRRS